MTRASLLLVLCVACATLRAQDTPSSHKIIDAIFADSADRNVDAPVVAELWVGDHSAAGMALSPTPATPAPVDAVLNVAWDLDIRYDADAYIENVENVVVAGAHDFNEHLRNVQYAKVGLVDGGGNEPTTLAAAVLQLHQLASPRANMTTSDAERFTQPVRRVLVHCHSGRSRSVTVAASYVWQLRAQLPESLGATAWRDYDDALAFVKRQRHQDVDDHTWPVSELRELGHWLAARQLLSVFDDAPTPTPPPTASPSPSVCPLSCEDSHTFTRAAADHDLVLLFVFATALLLVVLVGTCCYMRRQYARFGAAAARASSMDDDLLVADLPAAFSTDDDKSE